MAGKTSKKSAKVGKKAAAKRVAAKPKFLAGGSATRNVMRTGRSV